MSERFRAEGESVLDFHIRRSGIREAALGSFVSDADEFPAAFERDATDEIVCGIRDSDQTWTMVGTKYVTFSVASKVVRMSIRDFEEMLADVAFNLVKGRNRTFLSFPTGVEVWVHDEVTQSALHHILLQLLRLERRATV